MSHKITVLDSGCLDDMREAWNLFQIAYGHEADLLHARFFPPLTRSVADLGACGSQIYALREGQEMIGAVEIHDGRDHQCDIYSLVVHPTRFRQGFGSLLLSYIVERFYLKPLVARGIYKNPRTTRLYSRFGFYDGGRELWSNGIQLVQWKLDARSF